MTPSSVMTSCTATLPMGHPLLQAARLGLCVLTAGQVSRHTSTPWSNILEDTHGNDKARRPAHHRQLSAHFPASTVCWRLIIVIARLVTSLRDRPRGRSSPGDPAAAGLSRST